MELLSQNIAIESEIQMHQFAGCVARHVKTGDVVTLDGDLGAGKTSFSRGFIQSLTSEPCEVLSPTFALVQPYELEPFNVSHFDMYRLEHANEAVEIGLIDALDHDVVLIEWPQIVDSYLPAERLSIKIDFSSKETHRMITLQANGAMIESLKAIIATWKEC